MTNQKIYDSCLCSECAHETECKKCIVNVNGIVDKAENKHTADIQFVSYDGSYPNLCSGQLVITVDGEEYTFPKFSLRSGGSCSCSSESEEVTYGSWYIDWDTVGFFFTAEEKKRITDIVNENVIPGCCGGCI